jgi:two-component system sensor histidine kinase TctE
MWRADALGVDLGVAGIDDPVQIMGDSALIEGTLNNLIDNALRHGKPPDGSPAIVTVQLRNHANGTTLLVADNGPGIDPKARQLLMQRWQQAAMPSRQDGLKHHGVGLGLAIVFRYAGLLGTRFELGDNAGADGALASGLCAALHWPPGNAPLPTTHPLVAPATP